MSKFSKEVEAPVRGLWSSFLMSRAIVLVALAVPAAVLGAQALAHRAPSVEVRVEIVPPPAPQFILLRDNMCVPFSPASFELDLEPLRAPALPPLR